MKKILVTGASGFIGKPLCKVLLKSGKYVRGTVRSLNLLPKNDNIEYVLIEDMRKKTNWKDVLVGIDCIIHCAGRAHITNETKSNTLQFYRSINTKSTKQLGEQAAEMGVRRIIFLSSIGVNGLNTNNRNYFLHTDEPNPIENYAISKFEAEEALLQISNNTGLEIVIIRSPLVYGESPPGNLKRLISLMKLGIPLPFANIKNKRSFIGIDNLVDLLIRCIDNPHANRKFFLASDGEDLSTPQLLSQIASSMGRRAHLFPFPLFLLKFLGRIFGKQKEINRLIGSLRINNIYTKKILNWTPPISVKEGIRRMVQGK
jgi:nucleoside-diphosphate-sugar epimerase